MPQWGRDWPGLLDWELGRLSERASNIRVDDKQLDSGLLVVRFDWPFQDGTVSLEATFPSSYPYLRPHVFLRTDPGSWPDRHVGPVDGSICLLGRDSAQWTPDWYLVKLLDEQLEDALLGTGSEDPQGEPADFWWNTLSPLSDSYCLIDSSWNFGEENHGKLEIIYALGDAMDSAGRRCVSFKGVVSKVFAKSGALLAEWKGALPRELESSRSILPIPWHRLDTTLLPRGNVAALLHQLRTENFGGLGKPHSLGRGVYWRPFAFVHPIEIAHNETGHGWIVGGEWGAKRDFKRRPGSEPTASTKFVPVMRAGESDIGFRVPAVRGLKTKRIAIFGVGGIGAPIALELARNGCAELRLVDHDSVEPGNSIRWPLGAAAWGKRKVIALKHFLEDQYPGVSVVPIGHQLGALGQAESDLEALQQAITDVDIVVDAAVSNGVTRLLWDQCNRRGIPLIEVGATPPLWGGTVVRYTAGGGCPVCLQYARIHKRIPKPLGSDEDILGQPPGCAERTFHGADYDLRELSLQAVRLVVDTLTATDSPPSIVQTLGFTSAAGGLKLPSWQQHPLDKARDCCGGTIV